MRIPFTHIDLSINRIGYWWTVFGPGGVLAVVMSALFSALAPIAQYGWAAIVLAGIAAASGVILVASAALVAWRYFRPLSVDRKSDKEKGLPPKPGSGVTDNLIDRVDAAEREIIEIRAELTASNAKLEQAERELATNEQIRTELVRKTSHNDGGLAALISMFEQLKSLVESNRKQAAQCDQILSRSLRARDAEAIINEADQEVISIVRKLLEGSYSNEAAWASDYTRWNKAMTRIDGVISQWQEHHKPFLDIRLKDFEAGAPTPPPQSNIKSDQNVMRYKTVWLAQQSYANTRDNIFIYFSSKAGELPY
jgi:hypothetical protein